MTLTTFFQLLKRHITAQQKVPMLKHGHIQNQHTQISQKKTKKFSIKISWALPLPYFSQTKKKFFQTQNTAVILQVI